MTDERIIAYLLGELRDGELERFEEECFGLGEWPAEIDLAEEDLVDAYLRDELSPDRRERFERNYLITDARLERVRAAAAFLRRVDEYRSVPQAEAAAPADKPTWVDRLRALAAPRGLALRLAAAAAVLTVAAGVLWLLAHRERPPQTFAALTLTAAAGNRAEGAQYGKVTLPLGADALRIALTLPEQPPAAARYRAELEGGAGAAAPLSVMGQDARSVFVVIPASRLSRGQYAVKLFAVGPDGVERRVGGSYYFTVE